MIDEVKTTGNIMPTLISLWKPEITNILRFKSAEILNGKTPHHLLKNRKLVVYHPRISEL
tara:strand:+ start:930 stop:1109 length:180 start_codon:yes stop_codon:yes gene_type:complete